LTTIIHLKRNTYLFAFFLVLFSSKLHAQKSGEIIDQIVAVVGSNIIMHSEIEMEYKQMQKEMEGNIPDSVKCLIIKQKILDLILLNKAELDSVVVNEERVDSELERRIRYFAMQFGSEQKMEEFYGKSIAKIKADNREKIKQSMLTQEMQSKALKDVKISPNDVRKFFNEIPEDSLPFYSAEVEVAQIIIEPKVSPEAKQIALEKIKDLRNRIVNDNENFNTLSLIYSDDKGSATKGGELGFFGRGDMVPEFEAMAFKLKPDSVSKIIETKYGYHIMKLIDRKGERINVRHILIRPTIFRSDIQKTRELLDSIVWQIKIDSMKFEEAAKKYSTDDRTKGRGGFITEEQTGSTRVPIDELERNIFFTVDKLKVGEISEPELITLDGPDRTQAWRVLYLKSETKPHRANLKDDYQKFQSIAMQRKQAKALDDYIERARKSTYIRVAPNYTHCENVNKLLLKK
jgi:peptidyl-prolyl cis-trans isomerase SurA